MGRKTVFFAGVKIHHMEPLKDAFRGVFDETKVRSRADYVVHVNLDGTAGTVGDVMDGSDPRSIGVVVNPLGINRWNGNPGDDWRLVRVCLGSLSPDKERKPQAWDPDRWARLAARHGLPRAAGWRSLDEGDVVLLLPKIGGWLKLDAKRYIRRYSGFVRELRDLHPDSAVVVRAHPRNVAKPDATTREIFEALRRAAPNVRMDTTRSVSEEQYSRTKVVACDWSSAVVPFVMRGVPVCNPDRQRPGRMIAQAAVSRSLTPDEVMNAICQSVLDVERAADELPRMLALVGARGKKLNPALSVTLHPNQTNQTNQTSPASLQPTTGG
eukprot:jgi/Tetstr1/464045/TSEL_008850.t1